MLAQAQAAGLNPTATLLLFGGAFLFLLLAAPGRVGERLHAWAFASVVWVVQLPFKAVLSTLKTVLEWVGEEVRRYLGLGIAGLLIYGLGWAALRFASQWEVVLGLVALLAMLWLYAVVKAIRISIDNNAVKVRQRQFFRKMAAEARETRRSVDRLQQGQRAVVEGIGRRARGTPFEGAWRGNREARAREAAAEQAAAEQAEAQRREAARQAAAERRAKEEHERWAEEAQYDHDPFQRQGS